MLYPFEPTQKPTVQNFQKSFRIDTFKLAVFSMVASPSSYSIPSLALESLPTLAWPVLQDLPEIQLYIFMYD